MKALAYFVVAFYRHLLIFYPRQFRAEFGEEMQEVFSRAVADQPGRRQLAAFCLRELYDLPVALLQQYWEHWLEWFQGGSMITQNEFTIPSSRREAFWGALPFLAFGLVSMITKSEVRSMIPKFDTSSGYLWLGFYFLALIGLLIGWVKSFPRWAYAYLGWALVFAWWWNNASSGGWKILGYTFSRIWLPLGVVALIALLWTRSLRPLKQFFMGIWNDWTRLSFAMFTFPAWFGLIYDENHHPYLLFFMLGSTLAFSGGAYLYLRGANVARRMVSLVGSLVVAITFLCICGSTWDYSAYYGYKFPPDPWYVSAFYLTLFVVFISVILFGPATVSLFRKKTVQRRA